MYLLVPLIQETHETSMKLNRNITVLSRLLLESLQEAKNIMEADKKGIVLFENFRHDSDENFFQVMKYMDAYLTCLQYVKS